PLYCSDSQHRLSDQVSANTVNPSSRSLLRPRLGCAALVIYALLCGLLCAPVGCGTLLCGLSCPLVGCALLCGLLRLPVGRLPRGYCALLRLASPITSTGTRR